MDFTKVITIEPSRNTISFNTFDDIDQTIINYYLASLITALKIIIPLDILADKKTNIEICRNHYNYIMRIKTKKSQIESVILKSFLEERQCCYLEINDKVYRNGLYKDLLSLAYHPLSFRQPDDSIRDYMISLFQKEFIKEINKQGKIWNNIIFFGGEATLLGKILSSYSKHQFFYTDFQSIYEDIKRNYKNPHLELIDYSTWTIDNYTCILNHINKNTSVCIINTGYNGMGDNLAKQIANLRTQVIYVISCNTKTWSHDLGELNKVYITTAHVEIRTNYSVWIYRLDLQCDIPDQYR
jgi:hypothetical protein